MSKRVPDHLRKTLAIDPDAFSTQTSRNRVVSFGYALAGIAHMLRYSKNLRIQAVVTVIVCVIGLWLEISRIEWALIALIIGLNWFAEFVNSAIEAAVNLASPDFHPMAQVAKDVAAGSVLLLTIIAVIMGSLIFIPPFWEKIS
jgi:diacylglycerol kinase